MMKARYKRRKDGEGFEVPSNQIYRMACCDCGLVHDMVFVSEDGKPIGVAARRNNRSTAQMRKSRPLMAEEHRIPPQRPVTALSDEQPWQPMLTAPLDGTEVELTIRHNNWIYASGKDRGQWEQIVRAKWIDFNDGGWTWHGMAGMPVGWRALLSAAQGGKL